MYNKLKFLKNSENLDLYSKREQNENIDNIMEDFESIDANAGLTPTHFFVYKGKRYPFNITLFKCFSQYFTSDGHQNEENEEIKLIEETESDVNLSDKAINDFINFCQSKKITLSKDNVSQLHKLSKKFIVPSLSKSTEKFIQTHQKDFILDFLALNQTSKDLSTAEYEDLISQNLLDYVKSDQLLSLPIPSLHRIVTKYQQKNNDQQPPEIIEFLFKCLDRYGRSASVLFDHFNFGISDSKVIAKLLNEYSEKFDFHFINPIQLKSIYNLESEIIQREQKMMQEIELIKQENQQLKKQQEEIKSGKNEQFKQEEMKAEIEAIKNQQQEQIKSDKRIQQIQEEMKAEIETIKNQQQEQIKSDRTIQQNQNEMKHEIETIRQQQEQIKSDKRIQQIHEEMKAEIEKIKQKQEQRFQQLQDEFTRQLNSFKQQNQQKNEVKCSKTSCYFNNESNPNGIIAHLGSSVSLSAGGNHDPKYSLSNLRNYNDSAFYNYYNGYQTNLSDSYIKFDFGPSNKVDLYSYFIKTNGGNQNWCHAKKWRIEGSNDNEFWTQIDQKENDENLNGENKQHLFECHFQNHGNISNRFRYIRFIQEETWNKKGPYNISMKYFELYGDVYTE